MIIFLYYANKLYYIISKYTISCQNTQYHATVNNIMPKKLNKTLSCQKTLYHFIIHYIIENTRVKKPQQNMYYHVKIQYTQQESAFLASEFSV